MSNLRERFSLTYGNTNGKIYHIEIKEAFTMEIFNKNIERLCSFYVSDWHLVTMLLPYINKQINEKANIITLLEDDIEENVKTLVKKLNLKNEKKILNINWKKTNAIKYTELKSKIKELKKEEVLNVIFINGNKAYIDITNKNIEKFLKDNYKKYKEINMKIIDCYEVSEFNINMGEILHMHDKILNTSGEKEICDVFEGYA